MSLSGLDTFDSSGPSPSKDNKVINAGQPKQIRFVSNDGQPHPKRRRINAACQTCRKRKTRCSGEQPVCKTCSESNQTCLGYTQPVYQRPSSHRRHSSHEDREDPNTWSRSPSRSPPRMHKVEQLQQPKPGYQASFEVVSSAKSDGPGAGATLPRKENDQMSEESPASNHTSLSTGTARNRVPYFRYFGPTAIVPGFKQMVVQVRDNHQRSNHSLSAESPASTLGGRSGAQAFGATPSVSRTEPTATVDIPFYDATDPLPNPPLITHLCETFFTHLGCNFPFLQRERFLRDLEEKRVDAILVDAVCAIAARFSSHSLLSTPSEHTADIESENEVPKASRGHPFAQRAMSAVVDTFACPTMAVAQACLLLAYEEFGSNHDSGLWMYLGTSIRMAQDLGMQKLEGLHLEGRIGPTPKTAKNGQAGKLEEKKRAEIQTRLTKKTEEDGLSLEDRRASERERIDTFYCIFFLDRCVSSGTGRPVTLRDKDIEISFPQQPEVETKDGWPAPFPPLIRIVHLYGRVTDLLNAIREVNHVTPETLKRLAGMENDLTGIYQRLSPKLHFNAVNFQHYVKAEQGTSFILLHFWFHTLIVLLHQPTLLHSFEGRIQQLFPNSRELSMSSAKTIADILAFAELIDAKSFIGNPFTSQPMYIAACAFLMEAAAQASQPTSRSSTPSVHHVSNPKKSKPESSSVSLRTGSDQEQKLVAKHTLLATAANQNYQRCYKALKSLETYWAGTKYIVTVLDQKAKGIMDPLLYTTEEIDSALELPRTEPAFTSPGWRRSVAHIASMGATASSYSRLKQLRERWNENTGSSKIDPSHAIGWSLTGTTNSPNPNLSFLFQSTQGEPGSLSPHQNATVGYGSVLDSHPNEGPDVTTAAAARPANPSTVSRPEYAKTGKGVSSQHGFNSMPPPLPKISPRSAESVSTTDADLLLGLHSPYATSAGRTGPATQSSYDDATPPRPHQSTATTYNYNPLNSSQLSYFGNNAVSIPPGGNFTTPLNDIMMIESQDIDMSGSQGNLPLPLAGDMIPWLEYLPQDVLNYFGDPQTDLSMINTTTLGPPDSTSQNSG